MTTRPTECWDCKRFAPRHLMLNGRCAKCGDAEMTRLRAAIGERDERIRDLLAVVPGRDRDGRLTEAETVAFLAARGRKPDGSPIVTMPVGRPPKASPWEGAT